MEKLDATFASPDKTIRKAVSKRQTQSELKEVFYNSKPISNSMWEGVSPSGVKIQGY